MKKVAVALNALTVILVVGAGVLYYFSLRKLGMVRWLNFHSQRIRDAIPVDLVKYVVFAAGIALIVLLAWRIAKSPGREIGDIVNVVFAFMIVLVDAYAIFCVTHEVTHADVFIVVIGSVAVLLQAAGLGLRCVVLGRM